MIKLKSSKVNLAGISNQLLLAIFIADAIYLENGFDCVLTSVNDSTHSKTSLHYSGNAVDLRTREIPVSIIGKIVEQLQDALKWNYDVVLESNHIHIEYQPKRQYIIQL